MNADRALAIVAWTVLGGGLVLLGVGIWAGEDRGAK